MKELLPISITFRIKKAFFFPNQKLNKKGFTLAELLVVIVIIAVLAVMGFAVFSGLTGRGNDSRRVADIKAIADVLENKRTAAMADYGGLTITDNDFAGGKVPVDPVGTRQYCIKTGTAVVNNAALTTDITAAGVCVPTASWNLVSNTTTVAASQTNFKVCVLLTNNSTIRCVGSKQ